MNPFQRLADGTDRFQQRHRVLAVPVAVWTKFNDDQAGNLAALIAYYGFVAIFPLLLVLVTVLDMVLRNPGLRAELIDSALAQYPIVGPQIKNHLGSISGTGMPITVGIVFLLLGARGVANAMQNALCQIWDIPKERRPGFPMSQVWGFALLFIVGIGFIVTTFVSGVAGGAGHLLTGAGAHVGAVAVSLALNIGMFWLGFRIATARQVPWRDLRTGAIIAAVVWQVLQIFGGYVVSHQLQRASNLYGTFGVVLGLIAWLFLQAEVTIYAAEVDTVLTKGLWPRALLPAQAAPAEQDAQDAQASGTVPAAREPAEPGGTTARDRSDKKAGKAV